MVGNLKVFDKLINGVKEHPKETVVIIGTGVLIAGLIFSTAEKDDSKKVYPFMPRPTEKIEEKIDTVPMKKTNYITYTVKVAYNQIMRLEPRSDGKYVDKIVGNNEVDLLYIDGDYALISYLDPNGIAKIGFVESDRIVDVSLVNPLYRANKLDMYGEIKTNNCRIQNNTFEGYDEPNILTRGKKGEYVKIIGEINEHDKNWYIVIYRNYIGYMDPANLNIISKETFNSTINTNYVEIVGNKVRFRSRPELDKDNIILEFDKGTKLPIVSVEPDWYQVYYNGQYGYVSTRSDCTKEIYEEVKPAGLSNIHLEEESNKSI